MNEYRTHALIAFFISAFASMLPPSAHADETYIARAVSVTGKVLVRADNTTGGQMNFLKPGDKLFKGSIVNTGSDGAVKLLMTDRTIIDLGASSLFKMNDYQLNNVGDRKVDLSLDYGRIRASVNEKITSQKGKFTIRTKAATMGVRGTEFVVNSTMPSPEKNAAGEVPQTALTVMHGKVEVADLAQPSAPPVAVTPGFQFAKMGEGAGSVSQLAPAQVALVKAAAFQKDMTFLQTVSFDPSPAKTRADGASKDSPSSAPPATANSGKQTLENISSNVENGAKDADKAPIADLKLPGTFNAGVPQVRPIDQLNGRVVNLRVRVCVPSANGAGC
ncbi:MAG: FecR domain-containing protein [Cryobacterium sp.]|nr:FecR domain-containing protein [Oligoflexia bacterium]